MTLARGNNARRGRAPFLSNRRLQAISLLAALILVEMLPVEALLIAITGVSHFGIASVPVPLWYLVLVMVLATSVAWRFERLGMERVLLASAPVFLIALLVLLRISPSAYGTVPIRLTESGAGVFDPMVSDLARGVRQWSGDVGLTALLVYVWWRGLMLGSTPPTFDEVLRRFQWSMAAFLLALFVVAGASGSARGSLLGAMSLLLPLEVFVCLAASALANVSIVRQHSRDSQTQATEGRWLGSALLLAGLVATLALVINIFVNFESISALLRQLGPVGLALDTSARWLVNAITQVLAVVIGRPIDWLSHFLQSQARPLPQRATPPPQCSPHSTSPACINPKDALNRINTVSQVTLIVLEVIVVVTILVIFAVLLRRLLGRQAVEDDAVVQEERETIGGRGLFGAQLRSLLARAPKREAAVERLATGTVRASYRDVLRVAARVGLGRAPTETPDEYARRVVGVSPLAESEVARGDVVALSEVYDMARYGDREPMPEEQEAARGRSRRLVKRLMGQR